MKYIKGTKASPTITIVCCTHGDEQFGLTVFEHFKNKLEQYSNLALLIANEPAVAQNKRFIHTDLNRSYPGKPGAIGEKGLAHEILQEVKKSEYVIDIHTTYSDVELVPIITSLNSGTKQLLQYTSATNIVQVADALGTASMLNFVAAGIGLEFGRSFSDEQEDVALGMIEQIIEGINENTIPSAKERSVFLVDSVIEDTVPMPEGAKNFELVPALGIYPFLLSEKSYKGLHCLAAREKKSILL